MHHIFDTCRLHNENNFECCRYSAPFKLFGIVNNHNRVALYNEDHNVNYASVSMCIADMFIIIRKYLHERLKI